MSFKEIRPDLASVLGYGSLGNSDPTKPDIVEDVIGIVGIILPAILLVWNLLIVGIE